MRDGFIGKQIRRSNRNLLLTNLGVLLVPLAIGMISPRYWYNFASGPFPIEKQTLLSIDNPDQEQKYFVSVEGDKSITTGLQEITQRVSKRTRQVRSEEVTAEYVALKVEEKILIVKATANSNGTKFTGALEKFPEEVRSRLIDKVEAENLNMKGVFLPFMLRQGDFRLPGYMGLGIGLPCLLISAWNLQNWLRRRNSPQLHPIAKSLSKISDSPEVAVAQIDAEVQSESNKFTLGSLQITPSWLLRRKSFGLDIMKLDQIVWIYPKITQHKRNGVSTGTTYTAIIYDRQGKCLDISGRQQDVEQVIKIITNQVPWIIAGFSDELNKLWMSDRNQIFDYVEQRRQQQQFA
jgi:hypothetical protein